MRRFSFVDFARAAIVIATAFGSSSTSASGLVQTFVSGSANPANTACTRAAPCSTFSAAYTATEIGGEIVCLDSGNFGPTFTINHSITINCTGTNGNMISSGFTVTTVAADVVVLKGLDFEQRGYTSDGSPTSGIIKFVGAGVLHVENSRVNNIGGNTYNGIFFAPIGPAKLIVADSAFTNIGTSGTVAGICIKPASGVTANVSIERSRIDANNFGIIADGTGGGIIRGVVRDSFVSGNTNNGITISTTTTSVVLSVDNTTVTGNNFGLVASGANAGMLVSRTSVATNNTGLFTSNGGVLISYKNNSVNANFTTDGAFTSSITQQ